ncbi:hypothetical protein QDT91_16575 [Mycolicibacterium aubagnense]|uniref:hypothetical protein n=1 Tax=Mycolicibacterium aubagnense TaxID=319707 RepID=UPI0013D0C7E8|nr:hypothetical protein [Mycolicibacterium aubagnense]WGI30894.1 hypothetical protein QDT91_16575 [Mycolicibacterium aubagnense]
MVDVKSSGGMAAVSGSRGGFAVGVRTNTLLCDAEIAPDGSVVVIEDVGANGLSGVYVHPDIDGDGGTARALWVHTMGIHECDLVGRLVRVRVFAGSDARGLGVPTFDGRLDIASGVLALGDRHNRTRQLLFGAPAVVPVRVFLGNEIDTIRFGDSESRYPVSGPSEVNVLLPADAGFVHALGYPMPRWSWRRRSRRRGRGSSSGACVNVESPVATRRVSEEPEPAWRGVAPNCGGS